jgi:uncharacterized protein (UPF0548 family)
MVIRLRRPDETDLGVLVERHRHAALTYSPVGVSGLEEVPVGYRRDRWGRDLGDGDRVFAVASQTIRTWGVHRGAGLIVCADGPPTVGDVVALCAPLPIGHVDAVCRIVWVIDEPDRFGFAYGTLPEHPEDGEESFVVSMSESGVVRFEITAVSRPRHIMARAAPPIARVLQRRATGRYLDAMTAAVRA